MTEAVSTPSGRPHVRVAILGHQGHGKTALVAALQRELGAPSPAAAEPAAERNEPNAGPPAVRPRGRLRDPSRVSHGLLETERLSLSVSDCPGARRAVRHTGRTLLGVDGAVVVVAADEGVGAQTREHLQLARAMGVERLVVFMSRCDRAGPDDVELVDREIRDALLEAGRGEALVLRGAAPPDDTAGLWGPTCRDLLEVIEHVMVPPQRGSEDATLGGVDTVMGWRAGASKAASGRLVCALLRRGRVRVGQTLSVLSRGQPPRSAVVASLEVDHMPCEEATAGKEVGLVLAGRGWTPGRHELRHATLCTPGSFARARTIECSLRLLSTREGGRWTPLRGGHQPFAFLAHDAMPVTLELGPTPPSGHPIDHWLEPGERIEGARLRLPWGAAVLPGDRFALADGVDALQHAWGGEPRWYGTMAAGVVTRVLETEAPTS
jgi:elongation factor Tu